MDSPTQPRDNIVRALRTIHKTTCVELRAPARSRPGTLADAMPPGLFVTSSMLHPSDTARPIRIRPVRHD